MIRAVFFWFCLALWKRLQPMLPATPRGVGDLSRRRPEDMEGCSGYRYGAGSQVLGHQGKLTEGAVPETGAVAGGRIGATCVRS